jgi:hypothetical protein
MPARREPRTALSTHALPPLQPSAGSQPRADRSARLARFGLAFFWFFVGSLFLAMVLPALHASENVQSASGFALMIGCIVYYFRKR